MNNFFESVKNRMPHFFIGVDVLEYVPHASSKTINKLFTNSRHFVINPQRNNLDNIKDNQFNVCMSIDYFQYSPNYLIEFERMHRVSSKFVLFSCAAPGSSPKRDFRYYKNLTMSDFYNCLDIELMFETYVFDIDYSKTELYFWGVKRNEV